MHLDNLYLNTRFLPPRISTQPIPRPRLLEDLQRMEQCGVGLVIGSPGFGKTTLLVQWWQTMQKARAEVAWLSLSADDKHLGAFWTDLRTALQRLGLNLENDIPLEGASSESIDWAVAAIVEGAAGVAKQLFLVLDDYQHVTDPRAHGLMQRLLEHAPANLHVLIASRVVPPLSLSRLRLMGQVLELECASLPFDLGETRRFLQSSLAALKLSAEEVHLIHELTRGWPASLQLVVILLSGRPEARKTLRGLGWRSTDLQAYLAEEVMAQLPVELVDFMEGISICRRFNASLAAAVTGCSDSADLLRRLEVENLLIFRVEADDRQPWYRFHPLFGEFLYTRLAGREAKLAELHRRAARWLAERTLLAESVRHATLGGDLEFAADVIERAAPTTWGLDQLTPLLRLLDRLPQEVLFARPRLFFVGCLAYALTARPAKAEAWLAAFQRSGATPDADGLARLRIVQAAIEIQRDRSEPVIALLEGGQPLSDDYSVMRYGPSTLLALAYSAAGRSADARQCLDECPVAESERDDEMAQLAESMRVLCSLQEGRVREAERLGAQLLARAVAVHGRHSVSAYITAAVLAQAYCELDRIDEAREVLANRIGLLQWSHPSIMLCATLCRAHLDLLQESPAAALAFLERQERSFRGIGQDRAMACCLAEQVRILLLENAVEDAAERVARLDKLAMQYAEARGFQSEIPMSGALARARLALAASDYEHALEASCMVRDYAQRYVRGRLEVTALLLMARAEAGLRHPTAVDALLGEALQQGARLGLVRTFVDEGPALLRLLNGFAARMGSKGERAYLDELLRRFGCAEAADQVSLSPRELAIMDLVSKSMSNKRIALALNISLETVKWNLKNIYTKLDVSSRYDAMTRAHKQGLIR